ncbi:MAG: hypothetical protein PCFJNLEI_01982 [Verrucomicrobiae bacterium]|nr:hypothetical protein [Verrucomicrobiae bacterium]
MSNWANIGLRSFDSRPLNPGHTHNIGSQDHLTQVQHKYDHIEIVDHFDHGSKPVGLHLVTKVDRHGNITYEWE